MINQGRVNIRPVEQTRATRGFGGRRKNRQRPVCRSAVGADFVGPDPSSTIAMLCLFHVIGDAFSRGFTSLRKISRFLETQSFGCCYPNWLPYGKSSLSRCCEEASVYFGQCFELTGKADLFEYSGTGRSITGLTEIGVDAWALTRDTLLWLKIIEEK